MIEEGIMQMWCRLESDIWKKIAYVVYIKIWKNMRHPIWSNFRMEVCNNINNDIIHMNESITEECRNYIRNQIKEQI